MPQRPEISILLANEAGGARGHIVKLIGAARGIGRTMPLNAALARRTHAGEIAPFVDEILPAPALSSADADPARSTPISFGDYLAIMGMDRRDVLRRSLIYWRRTLIERNVAMLVVDYAPVALWAAQGLKAQGWQIVVATIGNAYGVPPGHLASFPSVVPGAVHPHYDEAETLAAMAEVGAEFGMVPLTRLPALFDNDDSFACAFSFTDPYAAERRIPLMAPQVSLLHGTAGTGTEVFFYFSARELAMPGLVAAITALPLPRRAYLPSADEAMRTRLEASGMIVERAPVSPSLIAERSRLIVHAAQPGTMSMAALAGLPQVGLPQHGEQLSNAQLTAATGILREVSRSDRTETGYRATILAAYQDTALRDRALSVAHTLRQSITVEPQTALAQRLQALLVQARQVRR